MTRFADGDAYSYLSRFADANLRCVGWLGGTDQFTHGEVPDEFTDRLAWYCLHQVDRQTRGFHTCELCPPGEVRLRCGDEHKRLGSAEITVIGSSAQYAAPDLLLHYVVAHGYKPPAEFIAAILDGPQDRVMRGWTATFAPASRPGG